MQKDNIVKPNPGKREFIAKEVNGKPYIVISFNGKEQPFESRSTMEAAQRGANRLQKLENEGTLKNV